MRNLPLAHLLQPVVELLLGRSLATVIVGWWWALLQAHVVVRVHVSDLAGSHAGMATDPLEYPALAHKRFS